MSTATSFRIDTALIQQHYSQQQPKSTYNGDKGLLVHVTSCCLLQGWLHLSRWLCTWLGSLNDNRGDLRGCELLLKIITDS